jgi:hypothetical protein
MTDDAKPQAVPKCEHGETVFPHEAFRNIAGVVDCRYKCWGPQPTQAVGDEVDASQASQGGKS